MTRPHESPIAPVSPIGILTELLRISSSIILSLALLSLPADAGADYYAPLAPLLKEHCTKCHGGAKQKGGLDLRSLASLLKGGENGPTFVPGKPEESRLFTQLHPEADPHMPPKGQLEKEEIALIREFVIGYSAKTGPEPKPEAGGRGSLPPEISPTLAIDVLLEKSWVEQKIEPAPAIDDAAFLRRITLDLLGRIPTTAERERFLAETRSDKREGLIDNLLASKAHARHLSEMFNAALLGRASTKGKSRAEREKHFLPYLRWAFETNRPWNVVGHDLIEGRPQSAQERGATWFLYEQNNDANQMATTTSAALFGKQVQCAQCHDHPIAPEIEQKHYWGLVAFFDRTRNVSTKDGPGLGERAAGGYNKFANLEGESSESELVFFTGKTVEEPDGRRDKEALEHYAIAPPNDWIEPPKPKKKGDKPSLTTTVEQAPRPKFSRRSELAKLAIEENPDFARAFVNRGWALLMGRGFVHPVDKMTSAQPPSHPELLTWLASDFVENGYDVRRLFRTILASRAYALSSVHPASVPPRPQSFARGIDKPLPAEALARSILVALGAEAVDDGSVAHEQEYRDTFVRTYPAIFEEIFSPSVQQAMIAANSNTIDGMLRKEELPLVKELSEIENNEVVVKSVFLAALGRAPETDERERSVEYLNQRADEREEAMRQFLWAIFTGAEFRMNH